MKKNNGLHLNKIFLQKRYIVDKKSPEDIAKECGVSVQLIYRQLKKFGLRK
jgi:transposase-like protein